MDLKVQLPFGAPPILPDVEKQLQEYILSPDKLPIHDYEASQQHWDQPPNPAALYHCNLSQSVTTLKIDRDMSTGEVKGFKEVLINGDPFVNDVNSTKTVDDIIHILENVGDILENEELLTIPPWFSRGLDFNQSDSFDGIKESVDNESSIINLVDLLKEDQQLFNLSDDSTKVTVSEEPSPEVEKIELKTFEDAEIINNTPQDVKFDSPVIKLSDVSTSIGVTSTEWAQCIDVTKPITDFYQRIPDMAFKYNFELDNFQKQAILKLEEHSSVLVAAHTSAGKTAVAEYAIALSQRHMTRTIYTSPIKALSNQKYRDFRNTFKDVGLITGDFQINQTGTCLIMTTEILRSMLLAHNEVIRDLEYVIFDEVHYINDLDRGHVWEEVVILLPQHVSIVMLSATIPNALQFADWVGRTKQRKMYVISTTQRPVPLEHYLYTGTGGSSKDERFLVLSATNQFQRKGYLEALEAKKRREGKIKEGVKNRNFMTRKQETTMWVAFLEHLQKHDKLPVVAFILSRKRCDENAENLLCADLTTNKEKSHIRHFFQQSIQRLKEPDQQLPQIRKMQRLLENGIGIHHSGILPILKEIVEMLFQERFVKVLFATETFAMGVNMPAKTVVFDSIKKFDGLEPRLLLPSEYIQMAGRAGRRGLDKTGTVIIICKSDVPSESDLVYLMKGMPKKIESQFRLTYSIILKLERKRVVAEGRVTVEEMMANSFKEADHLKMRKSYRQSLEQIVKDLTDLEKTTQRSGTWDEMSEMCTVCMDYVQIWRELSTKVFTDKIGSKYVATGRVILLTHKTHVNKLGIIVSVENKKGVKYKVLVLENQKENRKEDVKGRESEAMVEEWHKIVGLLRGEELFVPKDIGCHTMLFIDPWDIMEVTTLVIKIDSKIILADWEKRLIPRFRDSQPGQTFQRALEELTELTHNAVKSDPKLEFINVMKDMKIISDGELTRVSDLVKLKGKIKNYSTEHILNYEEELRDVFRIRYLEKKKENLEYLLSYQSMSLYADYKNRLEVLRMLKYVDNKYSVQMKGNVACEMNSHELLITELVLRNALNDLQPAEIAALLSCFVYQGKKENEPLQLTASLLAGIKTIKEVAEEVWAAEEKCGVCQAEASGSEDKLNFELVPVVYEWAREKPFSQIMTLTTIQEGIIVRCIQQLNETIRDVKDAARIIGEPTLQQKMEDASNAIKRDIVFAASLYMQ